MSKQVYLNDKELSFLWRLLDAVDALEDEEEEIRQKLLNKFDT